MNGPLIADVRQVGARIVAFEDQLVVFGVLQGLYFVIFRTWEAVLIDLLGRRRLRALRKRWWAQALGIVITFNAVALSLIFFRIDVRQGLELLARVFGY